MTLKCPNCLKQFKYGKNLKYHISNHSCKDRNYICPKCNCKYKLYSSLKRHMKVKHNEKIENLDLPICTEKFNKIKQFHNINKNFKPDIIDINYGCPVPKVTKRGGGSAALKDLCLMEEITEKGGIIKGLFFSNIAESGFINTTGSTGLSFSSS